MKYITLTAALILATLTASAQSDSTAISGKATITDKEHDDSVLAIDESASPKELRKINVEDLKSISDVTEYGGVGDDSTDNLSAFNDAISTVSAGDVVYVPKGTFQVSGTVTVNKKITIAGHGTIKESNTLDPVIDLTASGAAITDVTIQGGESSPPGSGGDNAGIKLSASETYVRNVTVNDKSTGIHVNAQNCIVSGSLVDSFLSSEDPSDNLVQGIRVTADYATVNGNISKNTGNGIIVSGTSEHIAVVGNVIRSVFDNAVYVSSGNHNTITGNTVNNASGNAYKIRGSNNTLQGNTAFDIGGTAIEVSPLTADPSAGTVDDDYSTNESSEFGGHGNVISNNTIQNTDSNGIRINSVSDGTNNQYLWGCSVTGNRLIDWGKGGGGNFGIFVIGTDHTINDNYLAFGDSDAGAESIRLGSGQANTDSVHNDRNEVSGNTVYDPGNSNAGVFLSRGDDIIFSNNRLDTGTGNVVRLQGLTRGRITQNTSDGGNNMRFEGDVSDQVYVAGNDFNLIALSTTPTNTTFLENDGKSNNFGEATTFFEEFGGQSLSSDPSDPPAGEFRIYQSDGGATGGNGDIIMKITNEAGTTKTVTLIDYSAN